MSAEEPVPVSIAQEGGGEGETSVPPGGTPEVEVGDEGHSQDPPIIHCSVQTNGGCFICLERSEPSPGGSSSTIQEVYSYLKINWRNVWSELSQGGPAPPLLPGWGAELKVELCLGCSAKIDTFKELVEQLEGIQRRLDSTVQSLVEGMEGAEKDSPSKEQFWKGMEEEEPKRTEEEAGKGHVELVKELRKRAIAKVLAAKGQDGLFQASRLPKCPGGPASRRRSPQRSSSPPKKKRRLATATPVEDDDNKTCRICLRKLTSPGALRRHLFIHLTSVFPYECPQCPNKFKLESTFKNHLRKAHRGSMIGEEGELRTTTTVKVTVGSGVATAIQTQDVEIETHEIETQPEPVPPQPRPPPVLKAMAHPPPRHGYRGLICDLCQLPFISVAGLQGHYKRAHKGLPQNLLVVQVPNPAFQYNTRQEFRCPLCLNKFEGEISLREHRKICPVRECPICSRKFGTGVKLADHMQDVHTDAGRRRGK